MLPFPHLPVAISFSLLCCYSSQLSIYFLLYWVFCLWATFPALPARAVKGDSVQQPLLFILCVWGVCVGFLNCYCFLHITFCCWGISFSPHPLYPFFLNTLPQKNVSNVLFHVQNLKPQNRGASRIHECPVLLLTAQVFDITGCIPLSLGPVWAAERLFHKPDFCIKLPHAASDCQLSYPLLFCVNKLYILTQVNTQKLI